MEWGQTWGTVKLTLRFFLAGLIMAAVTGSGFAATGGQASPLQDRSWESYYGVTILPTGRVVLVGDKGLVMTSDDQGKTWRRQQLKKGLKYYDLYSVAFTPDGSRGWLVGNAGMIFRSDDHGLTWNPEAPPAGVDSALLKLAVADAQTVCAAGEHGVIICSQDGGSTWNLQKINDYAFFDIAFTGPTTGFAVGEFSTVVQTSDAGKTWKLVTGGDMMKKGADPYFAIAFSNPQNALAVGLAGDSLKTTDGGKTWTPGNLPSEHQSLYVISPLPSHPGNFFVAGENGMAAMLNGGQLVPIKTGSSSAITSAAFAPGFAIAVGLSGTILTSNDGGQHWHSITRDDQTLASSGH